MGGIIFTNLIDKAFCKIFPHRYELKKKRELIHEQYMRRKAAEERARERGGTPSPIGLRFLAEHIIQGPAPGDPPRGGMLLLVINKRAVYLGHPLVQENLYYRKLIYDNLEERYIRGESSNLFDEIMDMDCERFRGAGWRDDIAESKFMIRHLGITIDQKIVDKIHEEGKTYVQR